MEEDTYTCVIIDNEGNELQVVIEIPKAVFVNYNNGVLTFSNSNDFEGGTNYGDIGQTNFKTSSNPWYSNRENITKVVFRNKVCPVSTAFWFMGFSNLLEIENIQNLNTKNVTDMERMFRNCSKLTELDVSHFDTRNVTNMRIMFGDCSSLTELDVSNFNTSNVTSIEAMFEVCSGLTEIDVSNFDTRNVTNMEGMFYECSSLIELDLSGFDTSNATDMRSMFKGCSNLESIIFGNNFITSLAANSSNSIYDGYHMMFFGCSSLTSLDLRTFTLTSTTYANNMFQNCSSLTTVYYNPSIWKVTSTASDTTYRNNWCSGVASGFRFST